MVTESLYEAGFRYRQNKLWKKLWDNQLFAVEMSDGTIGYVSIMGKNGEYCALSVYLGEQGFNGLRELASLDPLSFRSHFEQQEAFLCQDCLSMSLENKADLMEDDLKEVRRYANEHGLRFAGKNSFPNFLKHERNKLPWKLRTEDDNSYLCQALTAASDLSETLESDPSVIGMLPEVDLISAEISLLTLKDGKYILNGKVPLPEKKGEVYPVPKVINEISLRKVRSLKKTGTLECELILYPEPVQESYEEAPYFPHLLFAADSKTGFIIPPMAVDNFLENPDKIMNHFLDALIEYSFGPAGFFVRDDRTYAFLKGLADKLGIKISVDQNLSALEEAEQNLLMEMENGSEQNMDEIVSFIGGILQMDDKDLHLIPEELKIQIKQVIDYGILPAEIEKAIKNKLNI